MATQTIRSCSEFVCVFRSLIFTHSDTHLTMKTCANLFHVLVHVKLLWIEQI